MSLYSENLEFKCVLGIRFGSKSSVERNRTFNFFWIFLSNFHDSARPNRTSYLFKYSIRFNRFNAKEALNSSSIRPNQIIIIKNWLNSSSVCQAKSSKITNTNTPIYNINNIKDSIIKSPKNEFLKSESKTSLIDNKESHTVESLLLSSESVKD